MQLLAFLTRCLFRSGLRLLTLSIVLHQVISQDVEVSTEMKGPYAPCSCDCCLVAERRPSEYAQLDDGSTLTRKCVAPPTQFDTATCGDRCSPSDADIVLTSVKEDMDMQRYCTFLCRPATKTVGTVCNAMQAGDIANAFTMDGNGNADSKAFMPQMPGEENWGSGPSNARLESANDQKTLNEAAANSLKGGDKSKITFDIRKVIEMRKRAEAAGNIARAAAAEASTKSNREKAEHTNREVSKVLTALQESAGAAGASETQAGAAAADAAVDAADARIALAQGRELAPTAAKLAKELARAEIKKVVEPAAMEEGKSDSYRYGWDKPPNWDKIVAQSMAEPYFKSMVGAIWRASEYEGYAKGILGQAKGAQAKAKAIHNQANQYAAAGDVMQAKMLDDQVKALISKSHSLEAQAESEWQRASNVQNSVAEWQQAGVLAAGHAKWAFSNYFTPPPPIDQVPLRFRHKVNPMGLDWVDKSKR